MEIAEMVTCNLKTDQISLVYHMNKTKKLKREYNKQEA